VDGATRFLMVYILPLSILAVVMSGVAAAMMWSWARDSRENYLVWAVDTAQTVKKKFLAPIEGNHIRVKDKNGDTKIWGLSAFTPIDVPYPGLAGIPSFVQRTIKLVVVSYEDAEPLSNWSPDREVVLTPTYVGTIVAEEVTKAVVAVGKDVIDAIGKIKNMLNPNHFYIASGIIIIGVIYLAVQMRAVSGMKEGIDLLLKAQGLTP